MFKVLTAHGTDAACWASYHDRLPLAKRDVQFTPAYARVQDCLDIGATGARCALYVDGDDFVLQSFLWRSTGPVGYPGHTDIANLYGFGGPVSNVSGPRARILWRHFDSEFAKWRSAHHVISEFCAAHPGLEWIAGVEAVAHKPVVVVNIDLDDDHLLASFSRNRRRAIQAARENGRTVRRDTAPLLFNSLYTESMDRLGAAARWLHPLRYWTEHATSLAPDHATWFFDGVQIGLLVVHGFRTAHAHFLGTTGGAITTDLIYFEAMRAMRDIGCFRFYLGGGVTAADDDKLLMYKMGFSRRTEALHVYRRIFDDVAYVNACAEAGQDPTDDGGFFPAYRRSQNDGQ